MLKVPAKRPVPPPASVKVPVMGTATPAATEFDRAKAVGNVNKPNSTAMSATEIILFVILYLPCSWPLRLRGRNSPFAVAPLRHARARQLGIQKLSNQ